MITKLEAAFRRNFEERGELGASLSIWKNGEEICSLHEGWKHPDRSAAWESDTLAPVWSATKGPAAIAVLIGGQKYLSFEVGLNEDLVELLLQEEARFWQRLVNRDPPEPDGTKSCREILTKLYPKHVEGKTIALPADAIEWDRQLQEANANLEKWKAEKELAENKIKAALGYAEKGVLAGGVAYTWKASPRKGYVVQDAIVRTLRRSVAKH